MSKKTNEEKREILVRNVFACVGAMLFVILFIQLVPLYDIFEEFKISYIDHTLSQIMTRYVYVIVVISFVIFGVAFYVLKRFMLWLKELKAKRVIKEHQEK